MSGEIPKDERQQVKAMDGKNLRKVGFKMRVENTIRNVNNQSMIRA